MLQIGTAAGPVAVASGDAGAVAAPASAAAAPANSAETTNNVAIAWWVQAKCPYLIAKPCTRRGSERVARVSRPASSGQQGTDRH